MPRIADIIMDRLNIAGPSGSKSAGIRQFILDTYDADIHDKTVSMTLNRLLKEGLVRREGHIWFSASAEAKNPGDDDAGRLELIVGFAQTSGEGLTDGTLEAGCHVVTLLLAEEPR